MKNKIIILSVFLLPFIVLYMISTLFLSNLYLFEWTARNFYLFLWLIVMLFTYFRKYYMAAWLVIGNVLGILVGQFLGEYLRTMNIQRITQDMSNEQIARLHNHPGFQIWIITILICFIIGVIVTKTTKRVESRGRSF